MESSFCSRLDFNNIVITKFCTCQDSFAVVACAKLCNDLTTKVTSFPSNLNYDGKKCLCNGLQYVKTAHVTHHIIFHILYVWCMRCFDSCYHEDQGSGFKDFYFFENLMDCEFNRCIIIDMYMIYGKSFIKKVCLLMMCCMDIHACISVLSKMNPGRIYQSGPGI